LSQYFLFHTSANWRTERDKIHLNELLRVPFPLPGSEFVSPKADLIVDHVANKVENLRSDLKNRLDKLIKKGNRKALFDEAHKQALNSWRRKRKVLVDKLQAESEPRIYQYFGLTDQKISLIEDTNEVFIPSSTPGTWRTSRSVTLDPMEKCKVTPYAENGLGVYADTLTTTINTWAEAEGENLHVFAEGGTDDDTGFAMVRICLLQKPASYNKKAIAKDLFTVLRAYEKRVTNRCGALKYERDIILFQGEKIYIVRPDILLNWTRTSALNDAARIYGEIAISGSGS
jgi:hypothetical protein